MIREENFQTMLGIDTPASKLLWEVSSQEDRIKIVNFIGKYIVYIKKYSNDEYIVNLILEDFLRKSNKRFGKLKYYSLIENLLKTFKKLRKLN